MSKTIYNKLIRDKIPEMIQASGGTPLIEALSGDAYHKKLNEKLAEELSEYLESGSVEELADIGEVMHAILDYKGVSIEEFQRVRLEKLKSHGGFVKKLLLKEIIKE